MLREYEVTIRETLQMKVKVEAESRAEAEDIVRRNWRGDEYILDAECFTGVYFTAKRTPERGREEER